MNHSISDNSVAVGVPARVIGNTWDFAEKIVNRMPEDWDQVRYMENAREHLEKMIPTPPRPPVV